MSAADTFGPDRLERRRALVPQSIRYPEELPVTQARERIL